MRPHSKKRSEEVAFHFGRNLARARRIAGLSQEELAQRASLHRTEIGMLEHGQRVARIDTVTKLAGAMVIEPGVLLEGIHWTPGAAQGEASISAPPISANCKQRHPEDPPRIKIGLLFDRLVHHS